MNKKPKIFIGTDHAGFELKEKLVLFLKNLGYEVIDKGAYIYNKNDDYPDFISLVAEEISKNPENLKGIIIGGSGQGEAIVANKFKDIRAVVFNGQYKKKDGEKTPNEVILSREHNNANIMSLGARFVSEEEAKKIVKIWLETPFSGEKRHIRRLDKIRKLFFGGR